MPSPIPGRSTTCKGASQQFTSPQKEDTKAIQQPIQTEIIETNIAGAMKLQSTEPTNGRCKQGSSERDVALHLGIVKATHGLLRFLRQWAVLRYHSLTMPSWQVGSGNSPRVVRPGYQWPAHVPQLSLHHVTIIAINHSYLNLTGSTAPEGPSEWDCNSPRSYWLLCYSAFSSDWRVCVCAQLTSPIGRPNK